MSYVFHGNRTGDFIEKVIEGCKNIILTNVCNYYERGVNVFKMPTLVDQGIKDVIEIIHHYKPSKIILLGSKAKQYFKCYRNTVSLDHPSYVLRFNRDVKKYFQLLKNEFLPS